MDGVLESSRPALWHAHRRPGPCTAALVATAAMMAIAACASAAVPVEWRVLVTLAQPSADIDATLRQLAIAADVAAGDPAWLGPQRMRLTLDCPDAAACERAMARLAVQPSLVAAVARDGLRTLPSKPAPSSPTSR